MGKRDGADRPVEPSEPITDGDTAGSAAAELAGRCAERLLDDESLRADLTDDEYQPLQDWALAVLEARAAERAACVAAEDTLEAVTEGLRTALRAANDAIGQRYALDADAFCGRLQDIGDALDATLCGGEAASRAACAALERIVPALAAKKDEAEGYELVDELVAALRSSTLPEAEGA